MAQPLIGVTCASREPPAAGGAIQDVLGRTYTRAVQLAGASPVVLPNLEAPDRDPLLARLDGLLLSGGLDVDPASFGEGPLNETVEVDGARDRTELPLIRAALARGLPILGICRGIQSLNVAMGGTLYQDLPAQLPGPVAHRQAAPRSAPTHAIAIEPGSRLAAITGGRSLRVNSFHHQAVWTLAPGLTVTARADDGVIEAAEGTGEGFVLAVQFHPEDLVDCCEACRGLFAAFVDACGNRG
jgi:putative glutamine amidotransferase